MMQCRYGVCQSVPLEAWAVVLVVQGLGWLPHDRGVQGSIQDIDYSFFYWNLTFRLV